MPEDKKINQPPLEWVKSPQGICEIYANIAHVSWSLDDVRIRLAQMVDSPSTPSPGPEWKAAAEEKAAVTFSWRNAKLMRNQLNDLIENYEKANGEIKLDPKLVATPTSVKPRNVQ